MVGYGGYPNYGWSAIYPFGGYCPARYGYCPPYGFGAFMDPYYYGFGMYMPYGYGGWYWPVLERLRISAATPRRRGTRTMATITTATITTATMTTGRRQRWRCAAAPASGYFRVRVTGTVRCPGPTRWRRIPASTTSVSAGTATSPFAIPAPLTGPRPRAGRPTDPRRRPGRRRYRPPPAAPPPGSSRRNRAAATCPHREPPAASAGHIRRRCRWAQARQRQAPDRRMAPASDAMRRFVTREIAAVRQKPGKKKLEAPPGASSQHSHADLDRIF